jgi:hypothetical protein
MWCSVKHRDSFFVYINHKYEGVSQILRTGHLERELQMVQLSATRCSYIAILRVSPVSSAAITLHVASQRIIPKVSVYFVLIQSGNFWIHPHTYDREFCIQSQLICDAAAQVRQRTVELSFRHHVAINLQSLGSFPFRNFRSDCFLTVPNIFLNP